MLRFSVSARTHVGHVRTNNEDSAFAGPYLLLVADGVGGAAAGEVASASTAYVLSAIAMTSEDPDLLGVLGRGLQTAHQQLRDGAAADPTRTGMCTTLTAVFSDGERFGLAHVGDSRAYVLREGDLVQVTRDHTLVQYLLDRGQITAEDVRTHPQRSVVLRAVDGREPPVPDLVMLDLRPGDRLLLCSDGLSDLVPPERIAATLAHDVPLDRAVPDLVAAALEAGGKDNVTCVGADVEHGDIVPRTGSVLGAAADPDNLIDATAMSASEPA